MDVLKAQLDRLQKQLSGLSASQKMLTGALVAIMLMTLWYWGKYAGEAEMEPVTSAAVAPDELDRITNELANKGIKSVVAGDKVMVPADRKVEALAALSYARVLPKQDKAGFETMLEKMNPFLAQNTTDLMFNRGKEITVGQIVSNFPGVADAQVMIDPTQKTRIGDNIDPSATVTITMRDSTPPSQQLVNAAADVVEGAEAGLARAKIKVVVNGRPWKVQDTDDRYLDGSDQLELQQKAELRLSDKVKESFGYINGLMVSVTVSLNSTTVQQHSTTVDPKNKLTVVESSNDENTENSTGAQPSGDPGVVPNIQPGAANVPLSVNSSGGGGSSETTEKHQNTYKTYVDQTESTKMTPPGATQPIAATVRVPLSYFAGIWQSRNRVASPGAAPVVPTDAQLDPIVQTELVKIREGVIKTVGLNSDKDVSVETYTDPLPLATGAGPATASMSVPLSMVTGHAKEIALGGLAVLSLLMMTMMVRKTTPVPVLAPAPPPGPPKVFEPNEELAGIATDPPTSLDAKELQEETIRAQQMIEQVSTLVKDNPDSAATLVKRWLTRAS